MKRHTPATIIGCKELTIREMAILLRYLEITKEQKIITIGSSILETMEIPILKFTKLNKNLVDPEILLYGPTSKFFHTNKQNWKGN